MILLFRINANKPASFSFPFKIRVIMMMILRNKKAIIEFKSVKIFKSYKMVKGYRGKLKLIKMIKMTLDIINFIDFTNHAVLNVI